MVDLERVRKIWRERALAEGKFVRLGELKRVEEQMTTLKMSSEMQGRYKELFGLFARGEILEERINVVRQMLVVRQRVFDLINGYGATKFGKSNVAFAIVTFTDPTTRQSQTLKLLSFSGDKVNTYLAERNILTVDNILGLDGVWTIVPIAPDAATRWFRPFRDNVFRLQDAEAKIFEFVSNQIMRRINVDLRDLGGNKIPFNINLKIQMVSEMRACTSCNDIIQRYNRITDFPINVESGTLRFGTNYIDLAPY